MRESRVTREQTSRGESKQSNRGAGEQRSRGRVELIPLAAIVHSSAQPLSIEATNPAMYCTVNCTAQ